MSISRADRVSETNRIADMREDYEERQVQTEKRKNAEIKRNQKKHQEELKQVKESYEAKIGDLQDKFSDKMTDREQKHQKDIADVRSVYLNQLKNKMEDAQSERKALTENYEMEQESQKRINEGQKELLNKKHAEEIAKRDQNINGLHEKTRADLQETVGERSRKLQASYDKGLKTLSKKLQEDQEKHFKERNDIRSFYEEQNEALKKKNENDNANWSNKYSNTVLSLNQQYAEDAQEKSEILKQEVANNREKYNQKLKEFQEDVLGGNDNFKNTIDERYNKQVKAKDFEINRLKTRMNVEQAKLQKRNDLEKKNVINDYEKRQNALEGTVEEQRETLLALNGQRIDKVNKQNLNQLSELNKRYKMDQDLVAEKHRQDRAAMEEMHKNEKFNMESTTEKRIDAIQKVSDTKEAKLISYYDEYLDLLKESYLEKVYEQREKHDKDLNQLNSIYSDKFRKLKSLYENKLEKTSSDYESKIADLKDNHEKEKKSLKVQFENKISDKDKETKMTLSTSEQKYEGKIKTIQEQYENQLDKVNDRHQEELKKMSTRMQNYSRKA